MKRTNVWEEVRKMRFEEAYEGWNVRHFFGHYRSEGGQRSTNWVKKQLQAGGLVERGKRKGGEVSAANETQTVRKAA
jgi:hypothetical protein